MGGWRGLKMGPIGGIKLRDGGSFCEGVRETLEIRRSVGEARGISKWHRQAHLSSHPRNRAISPMAELSPSFLPPIFYLFFNRSM